MVQELEESELRRNAEQRADTEARERKAWAAQQCKAAGSVENRC
jgi:hypothetical protein